MTSPGGVPSAVGDAPWSCEACTFLNDPSDTACTMCYRVRLDAAQALTVVWEWLSGEEWLAYDMGTANALEKAFAALCEHDKTAVPLKHGWFAGRRGYEVVLEKRGSGASPKMHQVNRQTGMRRSVRRIGDDNTDMFVPVDRSELEDDYCCPICMDPFDEGTVEKQGEPVSLQACRHYCHLRCLSTWVKLKHACPSCRKSVDA